MLSTSLLLFHPSFSSYLSSINHDHLPISLLLHPSPSLPFIIPVLVCPSNRHGCLPGLSAGRRHSSWVDAVGHHQPVESQLFTSYTHADCHSVISYKDVDSQRFTSFIEKYTHKHIQHTHTHTNSHAHIHTQAMNEWMSISSIKWTTDDRIYLTKKECQK